MICWIAAAAIGGSILGAALMFYVFRNAQLPSLW